jgi:hypothetical protein
MQRKKFFFRKRKKKKMNSLDAAEYLVSVHPNYFIPIACTTMLLAIMILFKRISYMKIESPLGQIILLYRDQPSFMEIEPISIKSQEKIFFVVKDICNKLFIFQLQQYEIQDVGKWLTKSVFPIFGTHIECYIVSEKMLTSLHHKSV